MKQSFGKPYRVRTRQEFERAYGRRVVVSDDRLVVFAHANGGACPRLGVVVSKKMGGAVSRNRWKRLLREAFRAQRTWMTPGLDYIVLPRRDTVPEFSGICRSMRHLTRRAAGRWKKLGDRGVGG